MIEFEENTELWLLNFLRLKAYYTYCRPGLTPLELTNHQSFIIDQNEPISFYLIDQANRIGNDEPTRITFLCFAGLHWSHRDGTHRVREP